MKNMIVRILVLSVLLTGLSTFDAAVAQDAINNLDEAFLKMRTYQVGQNPMAPEYIRMEVQKVQGAMNPAGRQALANRLAKAIADPGVTFEAKRQLMRQLQIIATHEQVPVIAPLLLDKKLSHLARYVLEGLEGEAVDNALLSALDKTRGQIKIGIINTLAVRKTAKATMPLANIVQMATGKTKLSEEQRLMATSAANALGEIAISEAEAVLKNTQGKAKDPVLATAITDAWLKCAVTFAEQGRKDAAMAIYDALYAPEQPGHIRIAAFNGLTELKGADSVPMVVAALTDDDVQWAVMAMAAVRSVPGEAATKAFMETADGMAPEVLGLLIQALADRGDARVLPLIHKAMESPDEAVQLAAVKAAGDVGDATSVMPLAEFAAGKSARITRYARPSLNALTADGVNETILNNIPTADDKVAEELVASLADRGATETVPALIDLASKADASLQKSIYGTLETLAGSEQVPSLLNLLLDSEEGSQSSAVNMVAGVVRNGANPAEDTALVLKALKKNRKKAKKAVLIEVLGEIGHDSALDALYNAGKKRKQVIKEAALRALASWPTDAPLDYLFAAAQKTKDEDLQSVIMKGYLDQVKMADKRPAEELIQLYEQALTISNDKSTKMKVLNGLSTTGSVDALDVIERYLDDPEVSREAAIAAEKLLRSNYTSTASHNAGESKKAHDENGGSRWTTNTTMKPGMWFQLDMQKPLRVRGIMLDTSGSKNDYPRAYEVYVFNDPDHMGEPVKAGTNDKPAFNITFEPTKGRYIRIVLTDAPEEIGYWSIHELRVLAK